MILTNQNICDIICSENLNKGRKALRTGTFNCAKLRGRIRENFTAEANSAVADEDKNGKSRDGNNTINAAFSGHVPT